VYELGAVVGKDLTRATEHAHRLPEDVRHRLGGGTGQQAAGQHEPGVIVDYRDQVALLQRVGYHDVHLPQGVGMLPREGLPDTPGLRARRDEAFLDQHLVHLLVAQVDAEHRPDLLRSEFRMPSFQVDYLVSVPVTLDAHPLGCAGPGTQGVPALCSLPDVPPLVHEPEGDASPASGARLAVSPPDPIHHIFPDLEPVPGLSFIYYLCLCTTGYLVEHGLFSN